MAKAKFILFIGVITFFSINASQAEVLSITNPAYQVANSPQGVLRPKRGMSMANVARQFGQPEKKMAAIGEPPITRWHYKSFIVFFEKNLVIYSVVKHQ